ATPVVEGALAQAGARGLTRAEIDAWLAASGDPFGGRPTPPGDALAALLASGRVVRERVSGRGASGGAAFVYRLSTGFGTAGFGGGVFGGGGAGSSSPFWFRPNTACR